MAASILAERYSQRLSWNQIDTHSVRRLVEKARIEDLTGFGLRIQPEHTGDVTSQLLPPLLHGKADLMARAPMTLSGLHLVPIILESFNAAVKFYPVLSDGSQANKGDCIGTFEGNAIGLLQSERIILNFLQKLSGIATLTHRFVEALKASDTRLLDTRKTTPGMRVLEKYAVACGGGWNHRFGLFDRVMIKDNHLAASHAQSGDALMHFVQSACRKFPDLPIEVEVDHIEQIEPVIKGGAHIILLDNFSNEDTKSAIQIINGRAATEASGGIGIESIEELGKLGLDFISTGATIHQSQWIDIGLDWKD